jgi:hypothetical protein
MTFSIKVENDFKRGRRGIIVYNSSQKQDRIIPWKAGPEDVTKREFELSTGSGNDDDYLVIAVAPGGGDLKRCKINLPANVPFTFIPGGTERITIIPSSDGKQNTLRVPAGPPTWRLKIRSPLEPVEPLLRQDPGSGEGGGNNVTVGDDGPGGWD